MASRAPISGSTPVPTRSSLAAANPAIRIYANVDSAGAYMTKVEGLGAKGIVPPMELPGAGIKIGLFADPEGNVVGAVETPA